MMRDLCFLVRTRVRVYGEFFWGACSLVGGVGLALTSRDWVTLRGASGGVMTAGVEVGDTLRGGVGGNARERGGSVIGVFSVD